VATWSEGGAEDATRFGSPAFYAALGRAFVVMCGVVPVLSLVEVADRLTHGEIDRIAGIRPHDITSLDGVLLAPLVHDGFDHLVANSAPLILMGTFVLATGTRRFLLATLLIAIVSGLGVWFLTPPNYLVIGASGVIFGWLGFLLVRGIVERSLWSFCVAIVVGLLYGWQVTALFPNQNQVSWQGHLFGFGGGVLAAILLRRRRVAVDNVAATPRPAKPVPDESRAVQPNS
jgi:membrane associated rhomboid family serine protease